MPTPQHTYRAARKEPLYGPVPKRTRKTNAVVRVGPTEFSVDIHQARFERRGRVLDFGRPPRHDLREIMNAILYVDRTGSQWACLPRDSPPHQTVYGYFAIWQTNGIFTKLNGLLRGGRTAWSPSHWKGPCTRTVPVITTRP